MARKHVPLRTCVQCRQIRPKRELMRIVRSPDGSITIDERGKAAGRGAYVCRCRVCLFAAIERRKLDHSLKTALAAEDRERLRAYGASLPDVLQDTSAGSAPS